jgi:hypothetical protein
MCHIISVKVNLILAVVMWFSALLLYVVFSKFEDNVKSATNADALRLFRCGSAKKIVAVFKVIQKLLLLLLVIVSGYLIVSVGIRAVQSINASTSSSTRNNGFLSALINVDIFFGWLFLIGAYITTRILIKFFDALYQKCKELGLSA